jgi:hypothetical protein
MAGDQIPRRRHGGRLVHASASIAVQPRAVRLDVAMERPKGDLNSSLCRGAVRRGQTDRRSPRAGMGQIDALRTVVS